MKEAVGAFGLENERASGLVSRWSTYQRQVCTYRCAYQVVDGNSIRRHNQVTRNAYIHWLPGRFQL